MTIIRSSEPAMRICRGIGHPAKTQDPPVLEAAVQAFLDQQAGMPPLHSLSIEEARAAFIAIQNQQVVAVPPVTMEDHLLPVGPTGSVRVRILHPAEDSGLPLPVTLYLHGGGWVMGGWETHSRLVFELAAGAQTAVIFVDYVLAPEARYPVQNEQAYAALEFVAANAASLRLDASRIAVAGDDAGGTMATAVTMMAKQRRGPEIAFQLLFCPITADTPNTASYAAHGRGPWLTREAMRRSLDAQFAEPASRREPTAFPLLASAQQLNDLPAALVITAEYDLLRDEGEAYARRLTQAGVSASSTRYNGTIHDLVVLNALRTSPATRGAIAQACAALRAALYGA